MSSGRTEHQTGEIMMDRLYKQINVYINYVSQSPLCVKNMSCVLIAININVSHRYTLKVYLGYIVLLLMK